MTSDITYFVRTSKIETLITNSLTDFGNGELCEATLDDRKFSSHQASWFDILKLLRCSADSKR
jgi:hypothetical protein